MERFAFAAPATGVVEFIPAGYGVSLMKIREDRFPVSCLDDNSSQPPGNVPLQRFFSIVRRLGLKTLAVDVPEDTLDIAEENEDLAKRGCYCTNHKVVRITALKAEIGNEEALGELSGEDWLGVVIWKEDTGVSLDGSSTGSIRRIFESVVRKVEENHNYRRGEPERTVVCGTVRQRFSGHLFCQQNGVTNVCAHAAIRCVTDRLMEGGLSYRQINDYAGIDHRVVTLQNKEKATRGLSAEEVKQVIERAGFMVQRCIYHAEERTELIDRIPYQDRLYATMESGYPSLLFFRSAGNPDLHVVPVFGHTMNRDMWGPRAGDLQAQHFPMGRMAGFSPSHLWLSAFVMHDDVLGQNYCVPRHYLPQMKRVRSEKERQKEAATLETLRGDIRELARMAGDAGQEVAGRCLGMMDGAEDCEWTDSGVAYVLTLRPESVMMDGADLLPCAFRLVQLMFNHLISGGEAGGRLLKAMVEQTMVLRPLLLSRKQYLEHLEGLRDWESPPHACSEEELKWVREILETCPEPFWMVEISIPELFPANLRKTGELIVRPDFDPVKDRWKRVERPGDPECGLLFARIPGQYLQPVRMTLSKTNVAQEGQEKDEQQVFWCEEHPCALRSHTALFGAESDPANKLP